VARPRRPHIAQDDSLPQREERACALGAGISTSCSATVRR
jgi:hypothetical protein